MGAREALIIGASLMAMLVFFAVLRFSCNIFLDVFILDEMERARRTIREAFRSLCPWWHVRTNPSGGQAIASNSTTPLERGGLVDSTDARPAVTLTSKILTRADLIQHKSRGFRGGYRGTTNPVQPQQHDVGSSLSSYSIMCSICLHELHEGDHAYVGNCNHIFHKDCMVQWVESKGRDCPNCRCELGSLPAASAVTVDLGDAPPR